MDRTPRTRPSPLSWESMRSAGLIRGAIHRASPMFEPVSQACFFVNTVKPRSGDLMLILSLDHLYLGSPALGRAWVKAFVDQVMAMTGRPVILSVQLEVWRDWLG